MTRGETAKIVAVILGVCTSQALKMDKARIDMMVDGYTALLSDLSYERVSQAVAAILQSSPGPWIPGVADIRAVIAEFEHGSTRAGAEAWGDAMRAVSKHGAYRVPGRDFQLQDPLVLRCILALGWAELCGSDAQVSDRARFIELYDRLAARRRRGEVSPLIASAQGVISQALPPAIGGMIKTIADKKLES